MRTIPFVALTTGALMLAACGGGGSDAGGGPAPSPSVTITANNQNSVARAAVDGGLALGGSQPLAAADRASALSARAVRLPAGIGAINGIVKRALTGSFESRRGILSAARPAATSTQTELCAVSGSVTITIDDRDNSQSLSTNDMMTLAFNQCRETSTDLSNGTVAFTVSNVVADNAQRIEFGATLAFQHVSIVDGGNSASIDGSVAVAAVVTSSSVQMSIAVGSGALTVAATAPGYSDNIVYDPGMQIVVNEFLTTPASSSVTLNGSFSATSIGGRVTIATLTPIAQAAANAYPDLGQLRITGAAGSQLRITVIDATQVRLELDAAGDGTYETTTVVPWSSLRSL